VPGPPIEPQDVGSLPLLGAFFWGKRCVPSFERGLPRLLDVPKAMVASLYFAPFGKELPELCRDLALSVKSDVEYLLGFF